MAVANPAVGQGQRLRHVVRGLAVAALLGGPVALALMVWLPAGADPSLRLLVGATRTLTVLAAVAFVGYACLVVVPYLRHRCAGSGDPNRFEWHFLVPCRDEQAVIGDTVRYLRDTFRGSHVWVIDDDSDDSTASVVRRLRRKQDSNIHIVQRRMPNARAGRGEALNAGYRAIKQWMGRHADPDKAVLVAVDANGRPAPDCLAVCSADHLFGDSRLGTVQTAVRIRNRGVPEPGARRLRRVLGSLLVRLQDLESHTATAAFGLAGPAGGQLTRMSALDSIAGPDGRPWRGAQLEDLELGIDLLTSGWRTGFTADTHVGRVAPYRLRRLLTQRTHQGQGTMQCVRLLRRVWARLAPAAAAEVTLLLARPWLHLLGTLLYPAPFVLLGAQAAADPALVWGWLARGGWPLFAGYAALGLLPFLVWGLVYRAHSGRVVGGWLRSLGYGFAFAFYGYAVRASSWRALGRILGGRKSWAQTRRRVELEPAKAAAKGTAWPKGTSVALDH